MTATTATTAATGELSDLFERSRSGDRDARNELLGRLYNRIVRLTAVVMRTFPLVRRRREVESVANDLALKLIGALDDGLRTSNATDFFRFAGTRLRQLLIDEAEKCRRRDGLKKMVPLDAGSDDSFAPDLDPGTDTSDPAALAERSEFWARLHRRIGELPAEEVRVVEMHFLLEMSQAEVARVLQCEPKQVSRKWLSAASKLAGELSRLN